MLTREEVIKFCYQIPGQMWPVELGWLYDTFQHSKSHAEIGTYCGRSLFASAYGMSSAEVVSVDNYGKCGTFSVDADWVESVKSATFKKFHSNINLKVLSFYSTDAATTCFKDGKRFDSIFIDACHEYAECKADIEAWMPMLNPGGIMAGHDYWTQNVGVIEAVNEVLAGKFYVATNTRIWVYKNE